MFPYYQVHEDSSEGTDKDMKEQEHKPNRSEIKPRA
jgi:hypothetical protein